ncbi:hypothetical protein ANN_00803 [Periplaneta americana]|uniref:Uncharacterized protein n=1 Tax=Periplaneta americana TaxID=6978 RepID=A0ABQ8TV04_PERAM|nr:hypothetical protein ANN_00803 [Periplaneta americana]
MAGLCEGGNEPAGSLKAICKRMEPVKWNDRERNKALLKRVSEERMMLKLIRKRKKLPTEGCTGRNGERKKSSGQKKISDDRQY